MKMVGATTRKFLEWKTKVNGLLDVDGNKVAIGEYNKGQKVGKWFSGVIQY
jgi:cytochrome b subunit of formate dehydrogenase